MDISNPRRILAVSLEGSESHLSRVLKDLTGSSPESSSASLAGITHDLELKTPYYTASIPIWLDVIASPSEWASSFLSEEAHEVLAVLGGLILVFVIPNEKPAALTRDDQPPSLIRHVSSVVQDGLGGWNWDGVRLAIGIGEGDADEWDELCAEAGMEFVQLKSGQMEKNEFGEKTGIPRVREALESNDWEHIFVGDPLSDSDEAHSEKSDGADDFNPESLEFGVDRSDFEGLRMAIWETSHRETGDSEDADTANAPKTSDVAGGSAADAKDEDGELGDEDIAKVEKMMRKLQAAKEMGEGMSEAQRKRLAARAVEEVMREL
ncbi:hypothetical protein TGAM01_v204324 [Trichoderma gamsii]|uniref:Alpha and gamma adaptin binding protein p34 n=1 Tax=Trichoderma gamsii TaxID=398673 RepID=A0A2P4ZRD2_9HYPO|nr:hypothetical protein TGAM01_v204324 [Trichoderma gamsii]PON26823.1 hypothetical protein TGAM01_v204324 [Trichoderma gamsii]